MRSVIHLLLIATIAASCTTKSTDDQTPDSDRVTMYSQPDEEIAAIVLGKEHEALSNWANGDLVGYSVNFAENATYMDNIMAQERLEGLDAIRTYLSGLDSMELIGQHTFEIVDPKVQVFENTAVLTLQHHAFESDGTASPIWKASVVYTRFEDDWKVVHANWSPLECDLND